MEGGGREGRQGCWWVYGKGEGGREEAKNGKQMQVDKRGWRRAMMSIDKYIHTLHTYMALLDPPALIYMFVAP